MPRQRDLSVTGGPRLVSASISGSTPTVGRAVDSDALVVPQRVGLRMLDLNARRRTRVLGLAPGPQPCLVWRSSPLRPRDWRPEPGEYHGLAARGHGAGRLARPSRAMLDEFIGLHDGTPEQVRDFARQYGMLAVCHHGRPCTHTPRLLWGRKVGDECVPLGWDGRSGVEPISAWHRYARLARAIVIAAATLRRGASPSPDVLWRIRNLSAGRDDTPPRPPGSDADLKAHAWEIVVAALNAWIVDGDVRPQVLLHDHRHGLEPRVRFGSPWWALMPSWPLFGALGLQLALVIGSTSHAICDECGEHYRPARTPRAGESHYCPECGLRVAARNRQRRRRALARRA